MFVLNLGRSPQEHEAVILGGAGVSKGRIVRSGNGGTHSPHVSFEEHPPFPSYTRSITSPQVGERYGVWLPGELVARFKRSSSCMDVGWQYPV